MKKITHAMITIMLIASLTLITVTGCNLTGDNLDKVADVAFSYDAGAYNATLLAVELTTSTPGAKIYYSTDGSTPSLVYTDAIRVTAATTIKAVAVKDGMDDSIETEARYTFNTPLVNEDFSNNTNWGGPPFGPWTLSGEKYRALSDGTHDLHVAVYNPGVSNNFTVEIEIKNVLAGDGNNDRGINFRDSGNGNTYHFTYDPDGSWTFGKFVTNIYTEIAGKTSGTPVNTGAATNVLRLVANGSSFDLYVNGFLVGSVTDTTYTTGAIDLMILASTGSAGQDDVLFDNFLVW